ncbi:hypothetical protein P175DRAFT_0527460 [Aspergillus ochraceoroseus IBT 24754]|uniref:Thioesterase domain-containing protein n=2 Tax=Aspergillus ochraceoroseus TaxID=138278 RepID=A0A2T5M677_9EURO|nr:uncharacterized protein P175DRAFT_0527460 [Aspergillus ochraceoroseus IBT 24754]KKK17101.1 hypothetical protein AOCH_003663 [Aspergillus ochraceoroseus]PTU24006.1 hypothetical protein P175DRAFT_0527460 [Aspergillus ochraceoroseus IBT 24754]
MPSDDTSHFQSIAWVSELLRDESFVTITTPSRVLKPTAEDTFFATTINSPSTIAACLTQYRRPSPSIKPLSPGTIPTDEIRIFCTLGTGLNGYPGVLHGGMVASLLDECMGLILSFNLGGGNPGHTGPVTAYLNTKFTRPVLTPGTFVVTGKVTESNDNRKWKIVGDIRDADGNVCSQAECLYVQPRSKI